MPKSQEWQPEDVGVPFVSTQIIALVDCTNSHGILQASGKMNRAACVQVTPASLLRKEATVIFNQQLIHAVVNLIFKKMIVHY